jgi:hypothetical protein
MYSKANRKRDIAVQKNNLHEEVEEQQDCVLGARIDMIGKVYYFPGDPSLYWPEPWTKFHPPFGGQMAPIVFSRHFSLY